MPCPPISEATNSRDSSDKDCESVTDDSVVAWTADGPPAHWANSNNLQGLPSRLTVSEEQDSDGFPDGEQPVHFVSHPFASVSQALQQHILYHFRRAPTQPEHSSSETNRILPRRGQNHSTGWRPHRAGRRDCDGRNHRLSNRSTKSERTIMNINLAHDSAEFDKVK